MDKHARLPYRLFQRGEWWHATFSFLHQGKRIQFVETTRRRSRQEAGDYCIKRIANFTSRNLNEHTLDEAFGRFFLSKGRYQAGAVNLQFHLKMFLQVFGAGKLLTELKQIDVSNYVIERRNQGIKAGTINRALDDLRSVLNTARNEWDWEVPNLKIAKFKLRVPAENIKYFTHEEIRKILDNAAPHLRPIIKVALYTGFRRRNIFNLKWSEIDMESRTITVKVKSGKNEGGKYHTIPISKSLMELLNTLPHENEYVLGREIKSVRTAYKRAQERAGVPYRNFHTLRHTTPTWMIRNGVNAITIQKTLGHSDIKITLKYAHVLDEQKREAVDTIEI